MALEQTIELPPLVARVSAPVHRFEPIGGQHRAGFGIETLLEAIQQTLEIQLDARNSMSQKRNKLRGPREVNRRGRRREHKCLNILMTGRCGRPFPVRPFRKRPKSSTTHNYWMRWLERTPHGIWRYDCKINPPAGDGDEMKAEGQGPGAAEAPHQTQPAHPQAWLVSGPDSAVRICCLIGADVTRIGRAPDNDLVIQGPESGTVSLHHLEIHRVIVAGRPVFQARDLESTNGTFVNGERI